MPASPEKASSQPQPSCWCCGTRLDIKFTGLHKCAQGLACSDCYYIALGESLGDYSGTRQENN